MNPASTLDPQLAVRALVARYFFRLGATLATLAALLVWMGAPGATEQVVASSLGYSALALLCLVAVRVGPQRSTRMVALVGAVALLMLAMSAAFGERGLNSAGLGLFTLLVCLVAAVSGVRYGFAIALLGIAVVSALGWAEHAQWIRGAAVVAEMPLSRRVIAHLLMLAAGLAGGIMMARMMAAHMAASAEREQRFAGLLGIVADSYWELDAELRVVRVSVRKDLRFVPLPNPPHCLPWEFERVRFEDDALDALRADLEWRRPFRDLQLRHDTRRRGTRHLVVSGEPRFDERGIFLGYWGVTRDATADFKAREALLETEARYRELFIRMPSPIVLHRMGRVLDANPAALKMLALSDVSKLVDRDLTERIDAGPARDAARSRMALLDNKPVGSSLPIAEFAMSTFDARRLVVRMHSVRVATDGGPALLSMYIDETERRQAEDALRRSEGLLSHLVATSPDSITLSEMSSGRYNMVNASFTRLSGWTSAEVIGRTAADIGLWSSAEERRRLVDAVREDGSVQNMPLTFVGKQGQRAAMLVSAAHFGMDGQDYLVVNARDVTDSERQRLEREAILANASIGIAMTRDETFQLANPSFEAMFGWPPGSMVGQAAGVVWPSVQDYATIGAQIGPTLARGDPVELDRTLVRRDGSSFLGRLLARAIDPRNPGGGTIWIAEDVTEQRAIEQALARARDDAEAASRAKSAFLANTSHEIRTPLNGLLGLARLARQPGVDEARRGQYLEQISESAQSLSDIISDILDLSKIEAGKLHVEEVDFDLGALMNSLRQGYGALADVRGLSLELHIDQAIPRRVRGDPVRVRQILANYLTNALKFTPQGGVRVFALALRPGRVLFEVHDSGPGIDAQTQARLFRPFTQADDSTTRRFGGTGLGLSICRELARLMQGEVGVRSEPGAGSLFWAEITLGEATGEDAASDFGGLDDESSPLADARVLLVEDNAVNMMIAVALLEQWGVTVQQASDGRQALAAVAAAFAEQKPFDAVLMDVQMPVMSGHEATRLLRLQYDKATLPIVALTAAALTSERDDAFAAGMNDFLTKPIDAQRLHDVLALVLRARDRARIGVAVDGGGVDGNTNSPVNRG